MVTDGHESLRQCIVGREERATVAVTAKGFRRKKAGTCDLGDTTTTFSMLASTKTLCGILDHGDVVLGRDRVDPLIIRHLPEQAHREDRFGSRRDFRFDLLDIDVVSGWFNINENGCGADQ